MVVSKTSFPSWEGSEVKNNFNDKESSGDFNKHGGSAVVTSYLKHT
jgi:hypothetical protein